MLLRLHNYGSSRALRTIRKGNSLKPSLYQIRSYNLLRAELFLPLLLSSLALDL